MDVVPAGGLGTIKKTTVEECATISLSQLAREGYLRAGVGYGGSLRWMRSDGSTAANIGIAVNTKDSEDAWLHLSYSVNGQSVAYRVRLVSRSCNFGGMRWYMVCPVCDDRRVMKLHLPSSGRYFGCRDCHDLTYKSAQESDKRVNRLRKLEPMELLRAIQLGEIDLLLGLKAMPDWLWRM